MDSLSDRVFVATFTTELEKNVSRIRQQNSVMAVGGGNKISESVARGPERDGMRLHKIMSMCVLPGPAGCCATPAVAARARGGGRVGRVGQGDRRDFEAEGDVGERGSE